MANYTTIDDSSVYFQTTLFSGNATDNTAITHGGNSDLEADWTWIKCRSGAQAAQPHWIFDSVRGATKPLLTNGNNPEDTEGGSLKSWQSNGFTLGLNNEINGGSSAYASWNWKESTTAGFDIISYTGTGSNIDLSHNLSAIPDWIMIKARSGDDAWRIYSKAMGFANRLVLSEAGASSTNALGLDSAPTSSVINIGTDTACTNQNNKTYICYAFKNVQGFSKFGTYKGNGNANGVFAFTGFKVGFVMIKKTDGSENWKIWDNKRPGFNDLNYQQNVNAAEAESDSSNNRLDLLSNGFKLRGSGDTFNSSGGNYIYMAFAENPLTTSTGIPATAG